MVYLTLLSDMIVSFMFSGCSLTEDGSNGREHCSKAMIAVFSVVGFIFIAVCIILSLMTIHKSDAPQPTDLLGELQEAEVVLRALEERLSNLNDTTRSLVERITTLKNIMRDLRDRMEKNIKIRDSSTTKSSLIARMTTPVHRVRELVENMHCLVVSMEREMTIDLANKMNTVMNDMKSPVSVIATLMFKIDAINSVHISLNDLRTLRERMESRVMWGRMEALDDGMVVLVNKIEALVAKNKRHNRKRLLVCMIQTLAGLLYYVGDNLDLILNEYGSDIGCMENCIHRAQLASFGILFFAGIFYLLLESTTIHRGFTKLRNVVETIDDGEMSDYLISSSHI